MGVWVELGWGVAVWAHGHESHTSRSSWPEGGSRRAPAAPPPLCRRHGPERDRWPHPIDAAPRQRPRGGSTPGLPPRHRARLRRPAYPPPATCAPPPQVEYAMEAISHAGTAIGILGTDGVVLAAEKKISSKLLEPAKSSEKMCMIATHPTRSRPHHPRHSRHPRHPPPLLHFPPLPPPPLPPPHPRHPLHPPPPRHPQPRSPSPGT
jgi:hypothetical protein